jgi:hypothetical protein
VIVFRVGPIGYFAERYGLISDITNEKLNGSSNARAHVKTTPGANA